MATYKRRIVYLSDEEWYGLGEQATYAHMTRSEYVRSLIREPAAVPAVVVAPPPRIELRTFTPVPKPAPRKKR